MLKEYNKKRDFKQTAEPAGGKAKASSDQLVFVIQRHYASRLHYDFRLELEGVLKSWAVPKGPSLNPEDKRLAVMVEDHPFEYRKFYGSIPEGNYGAGEVEIWDEGFYFPVDEDHQKLSQKEALKNLDKGELKVLLAGHHLKGEFVLVRLKADDKNWLLIKHNDEYAVHKKFDIEKIASVKKKKAAAKEKKVVAKKVAAKEKKVVASAHAGTNGKKAGVKKAATKKPAKPKPVAKANSTKKIIKVQVKKIRPMLASTADKVFDDPEWIYEMKWDGYRAIASKRDGEVELWSRNELSFNKKYPAIVDAIASSIDHDVILDGEVIALIKGKQSFQALQNAEVTKPELRYCIFDLLYMDGESLMSMPLGDRKLLLEKLLQNAGNKLLEYTPHIAAKGSTFYNMIVKKGLEGIMAKKADSTYAPGIRTRQWLKIKNRNDKEAIIVGFTKGTGSRQHFGALILAEKAGVNYKYIGHTGTGFSDKTLKELYDAMKPLITDRSPFATKIKVNAPVTWVKPELVCKILFTEETEAGQLRHPVFAGLRTDKSPAEVVHEEPVRIQKTKEKEDKAAGQKKAVTSVSKTSAMKKTIPAKKDAVPLEENTTAVNDKKALVVEGKKIPVTNLEKIYFPEKKITKADLIAYYHSIAKYILPYLKNRPLSLKRNPDGIHGEAFYHKNAGDKAPSWVKTFEVFSESSNRDVEYIICNNAATLVYLANLGCIEMNPWNSTYLKPDNPSYIVIDIDPSDANTFEQVIETANAVKEVMDKAGLVSFCKTSGASGLHVYIPLGSRYTYDTLRPFAEMIATLTHELVPDFTSLVRNLKKRGQKIYVDFLQNSRGQTLASAYSVRPVVAASVSAPLEWKEVKPGLHPDQFDIFNIEKRIESKGDLFSGLLTAKNDLRKAMKALNG